AAAGGEVPLTPIQHWFLAQEVPARDHWNMSLLLRTAAGVDAAALARAVAAVSLHHDALRLRFRAGDGGWRQETAPPAAATTAVVDLSALGEDGWAAAVEAGCARLQRSLSIADGPLLRAARFDLGAGRPGRLMLAAHHLAMDGVSWRVLLDDLRAAYEAAARGEAPEGALPGRTTPYRRWAERLRDHAADGGFDAEIPFWTDPARADARPVPADHPGGRPTWGSARGVGLSLTEDETEALLREVPRACHAHTQEALLAAAARAVAGCTGSARVLVDVEGHGREEIFPGVDLSRTVGWFTTLYPVLVDLSGAAGPMDAARAARDRLRAVPQRGIGHGALRWLHPRAEVRDALAAVPRAQLRFEYMGQVDGSVGGGGDALFDVAPEGAGPATDPRGEPSHAFSVNAVVAGGRMRLRWTYGEAVHRRETAERLLEAMAAELRALVAHCRSGAPAALTPADFPLADLDEEGLFAIEEMLRLEEDL
ncbi:MAG TPA: condensation domain-containing protein, partial [Longimicrobium sp.]|nr:condensation domain-containing protein [Longimicrobium sp.]